MNKIQQLKLDMQAIFKDRLPVEILDMNGTKLYQFLFDKSKDLGKRWNDSGQDDFSLYSHNDYLYECIWTYVKTSRGSITGGLRWLKEQGVKPSTMFDFYDGLAQTGIDALAEGWDVTRLNYVLAQLQGAEDLYLSRNIPLPPVVNRIHPDKQYGLVVALEVLEHYKEPLPITSTLADAVEPGGYLLETTSFNSPQHCGHFTHYIVRGRIVHGLVAARELHKLLKSKGFSQVFSGYNGRPRIWQKNQFTPATDVVQY